MAGSPIEIEDRFSGSKLPPGHLAVADSNRVSHARPESSFGGYLLAIEDLLCALTLCPRNGREEQPSLNEAPRMRAGHGVLRQQILDRLILTTPGIDGFGTRCLPDDGRAVDACRC